MNTDKTETWSSWNILDTSFPMVDFKLTSLLSELHVKISLHVITFSFYMLLRVITCNVTDLTCK